MTDETATKSQRGSAKSVTVTGSVSKMPNSKEHISFGDADVSDPRDSKVLACSTPKQKKGGSNEQDHVRFQESRAGTTSTSKTPRATLQTSVRKQSILQTNDSVRRASKVSTPSLTCLRRGSLVLKEGKKPLKLMNTYKLYSDNPFNVDKVQSILVQELTDLITDDMAYDPDVCRTKALEISNTIRSRVKEQEYERYKLICVVTIGEKKSHDILSCAKFLWDAERDRYATYMHENMRLFAVATVFGLYFE